ncbi:MAG: aminotransferase class III-fold pyridoxal phosphate-dependent enzyme, partial [Deltaproteobacteria bacterium]|nr:aminotransferase class III-fold pyridoxal phosphate-dependent enzyme [Deltaproteobacteria bacterium]
RGLGLMVGIELDRPGAAVVETCRARGVLVNCTQENVLRLLPALTVTKAELTRGLRVLADVLQSV